MITDKNKICFIICYNNDIYLNEALLYVHQLDIPKGYDIDIITIADADSITSGYQAGMEASDAKYKIYMHQDVFILNKYFLSDTINIFENQPEIGMIGMVGTINMPKNGIMWSTKERIGALRSCTLNTTDDYFDIKSYNGNYSYVAAIDGLLIMTQYDITWRHDIFTGWDFYDASQSFEFTRAGYKIAVPHQTTPWVLHDCGFLNMEKYDEDRQIFLKTYERELNAYD